MFKLIVILRKPTACSLALRVKLHCYWLSSPGVVLECGHRRSVGDAVVSSSEGNVIDYTMEIKRLFDSFIGSCLNGSLLGTTN